MRIAGRFKPCVHMGCFDLETFVELNQRSRKVSICAYRSTLKYIGLFWTSVVVGIWPRPGLIFSCAIRACLVLTLAKVPGPGSSPGH